MQRKNSEAGSTAVACILALFLTVFTFITVYFFVAKTWWFPPPITAFGALIDAQFHRTLVITGLVFVLAQLGLAWAVFRYRDQGQKASFFEGHSGMELVWTLATLVMFVGVGIYGERAWAAARFQGAAPGALQVEVTGMQFQWNFRYAGPDGQWGRLRPELISGGSGNFVGLDPADPNGRDDVVNPEMYVPVNREIEVLIRSQDVTHNFYVRELRLKQDAVAGLMVPLHFNATVPGTYEIACAELCGMQHSRMRSFLHVVSQEEYDRWMQEQQATLRELLQP
jgi:cytochrome c oxidase subunit 2